MSFGANLREARKAKGYTQKQLAEHIKVKHNSISNWENDQNRPGPDIIESLCMALDVAPNDLLLTNKKTPVLTEEDERDIERQADILLAGLKNDAGLMLDGQPASPEALELFRDSIVKGIRDAKMVNRLKHGGQ